MKFKCIKGIADSENISVIVMQNDIVIFINSLIYNIKIR